MRRGITGMALLLALVPGAVFGADWPNWRGPYYNGSSPETGLPVRFSPTENVKWSVSLPGPAASTPIIWGDQVFLTSTDLKNQGLLALCLDRQTGKVRWQHYVGTGYRPGGEGNEIQLDSRSNYASPSPVTDGKRVVFFFGNGDLAAFDLQGRKLWQRNIQKEYGDFAFQWTFGSSPQLYAGKLYLQVLQRNLAVGNRGKDGNPSYLLALDPATGKELWRHVRPSPAQMESLEAYSTPIPYEHNGRRELIIAGGDVLTGHDPETGKELWRWGTWNPGHREAWWRLVPSPVAGGGVVVVCAPKRAPVYAARAGGSGTLGTSGLVWKSEERSEVTSDVPTPLFYQNRFYVLSDLRKALSCVEPQTGQVVWSVPLPGNTMYWASPTGADGKIYLVNLRGEVCVVQARDGKILHTVAMDNSEDPDVRSTIAVARGNLFLRTTRRLYCIGK
ncbi:MAG: PQQ-binding-like beta-propeller repeat protein [Chloroherpetonaceae bacterium]|nr:PQQ-like beta-propeller repeat protein [Chthonomonadaceae bacterium]MDW8207373.1 PQQ-binding-like beta-propeller repeat protein [Chloroherpetonaceae bacterium]